MTASTAIVIAGQMRTFAACVHTQRWHVFRHYPNADFFVSTVRDADTDSWRELQRLFPKAHVHIDIVDAQPNLPEPVEPVRFEPYGRSVPVQAVLRQLWQLQRAWDLVAANGETYTKYLRLRPDSYFHSFTPPAHFSERTACTPWWGRFGGVNDRFAVMGWSAAVAYFTTFDFIDEAMAAGCPLHPESLVRASLELRGCMVVDDCKAEFSTVKHDGVRPPEISTIDLAHAAW